MLKLGYDQKLTEEFKYGFDNSKNYFGNGKTFFNV